MSGSSAALERATSRALAALELAPDAVAWDAWLDAAVMDRAFTEAGPVLLRLLTPPVAPAGGDRPELAAAGAPGALGDLYGPEPRAPRWARLDDAGLALAPEGQGVRIPATVVSVAATVVERPCCTSQRCRARRWLVEVTLELAPAGGRQVPGRLVLAQAERAEAGPAAALALRVAGAAVERLAVPLVVDASVRERAHAEPASEGTRDQGEPRLTARELSTWSVQHEGELVVLRDHSSRGPREVAVLYLALAVLSLLAAGPCWYLMAQSFAAPSYPGVIGYGAGAAVLTVGIYTFGTIAHFALRYRATSVALLSLGADRALFAPWASRAGAVDAFPSGRFGAAFAMAEVTAVELTASHELVARSAHLGPYSLGRLPSERAARRWRQALLGALGTLQHRAPARMAVGAVAALPEPAAAD
ncbi:MAG: hypothetical protein IT373_28780 [Polyangiaceae bacterium]|nr:hypothetical protein [Polyangiaceae bacterium]